MQFRQKFFLSIIFLLSHTAIFSFEPWQDISCWWQDYTMPSVLPDFPNPFKVIIENARNATNFFPKMAACLGVIGIGSWLYKRNSTPKRTNELWFLKKEEIQKKQTSKKTSAHEGFLDVEEIKNFSLPNKSKIWFLNDDIDLDSEKAILKAYSKAFHKKLEIKEITRISLLECEQTFKENRETMKKVTQLQGEAKYNEQTIKLLNEALEKENRRKAELQQRIKRDKQISLSLE